MALEGVLAKLERADEHVESVTNEVARFLYSKPYDTVLEYDAEHVTWIVRMKIHREIPLRIATITGDCIHNLRSALDQLMYVLVESAGGTPDKNTGLPIYRTSKAWGDGHARHTKGLPAPVVAELDALQPYHGRHKRGGGHPVAHPLNVLHVYWNWDKHNLLVPAWCRIEGLREMGYSTNGDVGQWVSQSIIAPGDPISDGTELFRVTFQNPGPNPELEMHGGLAFDITLGHGDSLPHVLRELAAFVREEVIPKFEPFIRPVTGQRTPSARG